METEESQIDIENPKDPENQESNRDWSTGRWRKGFSGNIMGRPRGKTMKEYVREYLSKMTDEERDEWLQGLPKGMIWRMAEGNAPSKVDLTSNGNTIDALKEMDDAKLIELATGAAASAGAEDGDGGTR